MPAALYVGDADSIRRQKKITRESTWIRFSRGAAHAGDCMAADDPDLFGWGALLEHLDEDRKFGFCLIPVGEVLKIRRRLAGRGFKFLARDAFIGTRDDVIEAIRPLTARPLPDGTRLVTPSDPETIAALQRHITASGLPPRCGEMLVGLTVPGVTLGLIDAAGQVIASAHARLPHNKYSDHAEHAIIEQIAVAPKHRQQGIGQIMTARIAQEALSQLAADSIYADINADDLPARVLLERAGLTIDGGLICGEAIPGRLRF